MSTISASTTSTTAFKITTDTTGALVFQTGASPTTAMTLGSDQSVTFAGTPTYSGGTANGVAYLNGSKVLTTGTALVFDGTNLGLGVTPSAWQSGRPTIQIGGSVQGTLAYTGTGSASNGFAFWNNAYYGTGGSGTANYYVNNGTAAVMTLGGSVNVLAIAKAPSGTAADVATFTAALVLDASGNLLVGTTSSDLVGGGTTTRISANAATGYAATNVNTGTAAHAAYQLGNSNTANRAGLILFGSAWTTSGLYKQDGVYLYGAGSGGVTIVAEQSQPIYFATNNTERARFNAGAPILCLSGGNTSATGTGIAFPATQSASSDANTLDDYEEGTWTPSLEAAGSNPTVTYNYRSGVYRKIGNMVYVQYGMNVASRTGGSGEMRIAGLPFAGISRGAYQEPANSLQGGNWVTAAYAGQTYHFVGDGSAYLYGRYQNNSDTAIDIAQIQAGTYLGCIMVYIATA